MRFLKQAMCEILNYGASERDCFETPHSEPISFKGLDLLGQTKSKSTDNKGYPSSTVIRIGVVNLNGRDVAWPRELRYLMREIGYFIMHFDWWRHVTLDSQQRSSQFLLSFFPTSLNHILAYELNMYALLPTEST